jgi:3-oxoacyl-[acyl-carrier-protein] synthase II
MERAFGGRDRRLPVMATKAGVGHLLGSSGALEAVVTVMALCRGELHPAPPAGGPVDADCPVALVVGRPLRLPAARAAVSTSLAFGGANAALVFRRYTDGGA